MTTAADNNAVLPNSKSTEEEKEEQSAPPLLTKTTETFSSIVDEQQEGDEEGPVKSFGPAFGDAYDPPSLITSNIIRFWGVFLFALAVIWPPLILLFTFFASSWIPYCYRITDDASTRRQLLHEFAVKDTITAHRREIPSYCQVETGYWTNSRGMLLYTTIMTPTKATIKAVVGHCHAYTDNASHTKRRELMLLVEQGIAVLMIDYEGHGHSDGRLGLLPNWDTMTNDVHSYFQSVSKSDQRFDGLKMFLLGESMGGAVAHTIIHQHPQDYAGVVFQAPMCKISKNMLPPNWVIDLLGKLTGPSGTVSTLGYLPIAPSKGDLRLLTFKLQEKRNISTRVPSAFGRRPRLATAREMINITKRISESLAEFNSPFLIQHGDLDRVTDPELSKSLYKEASSQDKTLRLYEGMWHALIAGEPDENVQQVQNDAIQWILERSSSSQVKVGNRKVEVQSSGNTENIGIFDWILEIGSKINSTNDEGQKKKQQQ